MSFNVSISSLRLLRIVGELINPEAWILYYKHIVKEKCPIVNTWRCIETDFTFVAWYCTDNARIGIMTGDENSFCNAEGGDEQSDTLKKEIGESL